MLNIRKLSIEIVLCLAIIAMPIFIHGIAEDPKRIEKWFDNVMHAKQKATKLHFYFHEMAAGFGSNPTSSRVAQANMTFDTPTFFGMVTMMDDPLTIEPEWSTKRFGHAQGIYGSASLEENSLVFAANFVFTDGECNRSSIAVFGSDPPFRRYRELSIVGGSGVFRMARGIVTLHNLYYNVSGQNATVEVNVMTLHY